MKPAALALPPLDWAAIDALVGSSPLSTDSRKLAKGDVFMAFPGEESDGRAHIAQAIKRGASAVLWESGEMIRMGDEASMPSEADFQWSVEWPTPNLAVPELAAQAGLIAAHCLGHPSKEMWTVGITGTNGKTSCSHWLAQAFAQLSHKTAVVGTLGYGFPGALEEASHTTPDAVRLQQLLADYRRQGATHLMMEASSHGLDQGRVHGVAFDVALFTNLTRDHLDYHGTMEAYAEAKAQLFDWEGLQAAVINTDELFGEELHLRSRAEKTLSYGFESGELRGSDLQIRADGLHFSVESPWGRGEIRSGLIGRFNAFNLLGCLGVLLHSGVALEQACTLLGQVLPASGRMHRLGGGHQPTVVIDYAHTPDALEKTLSTLREIMPAGKRLYCVFGCGGDRDRGKRPLMGRMACEYADTVIVTSDNPRREDPRRIINDILKGVSGAASKVSNRGDYSVESDRERAIQSAIEVAVEGDMVLIAGKGHEHYQDVGGVRTPFSDLQVAQNALDTWKR